MHTSMFISEKHPRRAQRLDTMSQRSIAVMERGDLPGNSGQQPSGQSILLLGKTGNGKSFLGNAILGRNEFATGRSMSFTTLHVQEASTVKHGQNVKAIDTPDITNVGDMNTQKMQEEVSRWKSLTFPYPSAILLAVRCDARYTPEEYAIYRQIKLYWGHDADFCSRLIVVFTFGDRQEKPIAEELREVCPELKSVLRDANNRYVVSNQQTDGNENMLWSSLVGHMSEMRSHMITENKHRSQHIKTSLIVTVVVLVGLFNIFFVALFVILFKTPDTVAALIVGIFLAATFAALVIVLLCIASR